MVYVEVPEIPVWESTDRLPEIQMFLSRDSQPGFLGFPLELQSTENPVYVSFRTLHTI